MARREVRQPDEEWIAAAQSFFCEGSEVLLSIKYLHNSPTMKFALLRSLDQLRLVVRACPDGAELTLWRDAKLPFRGRLTATLLDAASSSIPDNVECLCVFTESGSEADPRLEGASWHLVSHMFGELKERMGECAAIGAWPAGAGSIQAVKGGIEGPR
jgi:hypothetical protein